jgi:glycosyltransferase involved in cell wall biosynthesis
MIEAISVIMPTYNAMPFVRDAVESILEQSFRRIELLIVNQRSTDGTDEYLDSLSDYRVRVIHREKAGIGEALDLALCEARHDWAARMDADDIALRTRLAMEAEFLEQHPRYALVSCAFGYVGANRRRLKAIHLQHLDCPPSYDPTTDPMILDQGMLFRREAAIEAGGYRDIIPGAGVEGLDLCLRLQEASYRMASLPDVLMLNRILPGGNTAGNFIKQRVGWKYAHACAAARRAGRPEPRADEFLRDSWPRGWRRLKIEGGRQFRLAGASWGAGRYLESMARLSLSAVLDPAHCASKFRTYFLRSRAAQQELTAS